MWDIFQHLDFAFCNGVKVGIGIHISLVCKCYQVIPGGLAMALDLLDTPLCVGFYMVPFTYDLMTVVLVVCL